MTEKKKAEKAAWYISTTSDYELFLQIAERGRVLDLITDELVSARTGELLEERIRKRDKFQQQMKSLHKAS